MLRLLAPLGLALALVSANAPQLMPVLPPEWGFYFRAHIDGKSIDLQDYPWAVTPEVYSDDFFAEGTVSTAKATLTAGPVTLENKYRLSVLPAERGISITVDVKITNHGASAVRGKAWLGSDDLDRLTGSAGTLRVGTFAVWARRRAQIL